MTSCVLDQNPSHQLCRRGEEVRPILPSHPLVVDESYVGFIHQRGCLAAVIRPLTPHLTVRKPAELRVHDRRQAVERPFVAVAPRAEHLADVVSHAAFLSAVVAVQAGPDGGCRLVLCSRRKPIATLRPRGTWLLELIVFEAGRPVCIVVHTRFGVIGGVWAAKSSEPATSSGMIERFAEAVHWLPF